MDPVDPQGPSQGDGDLLRPGSRAAERRADGRRAELQAKTTPTAYEPNPEP